MSFAKYNYDCDDLGVPSMWFRLGRVTSLDGAAPMEKPPLGGGLSTRCKLPNWKFLHFVLSREKRASR